VEILRGVEDRGASHETGVAVSASVGATNWAGGLAATEHLLNFRHRRIAAIAGPEDFLCSRARIDGYRSALERVRSRRVELSTELIMRESTGPVPGTAR
jgi:ABC-type sugar transport system substrate-binding protein